WVWESPATRDGAQAMSPSLLVKPALPAAGGQVHRITPESAGWRYVGFEVFDLLAGQRLVRESSDREQCLVLLSGRASVSGERRGRATPGRRGAHTWRPLVELPAAQARQRAGRGDPARGDLLSPPLAPGGLRFPARLHGRSDAGRDPERRGSRRRSGATRLP